MDDITVRLRRRKAFITTDGAHWFVSPDVDPDCDDAAMEIERLQDVKRRTLAIADERAIEAVKARAENERLRAALKTLGLDLANCSRIYPGAAGSAFKSAADFANGTLASQQSEAQSRLIR